MSSNNQPTWATNLFQELVAMRNSMQILQQKMSRIDNFLRNPNASSKRIVPTNPATSSWIIATAPPQPPSKRRQLVEQIANTNLPPGHCLNHRLYGPSTRRCLGNCTYVQPTPIIVQSRPKATITSTPARTSVAVKTPEPSTIQDWNESSQSPPFFRNFNLSDSSSDDEKEIADKIRILIPQIEFSSHTSNTSCQSHTTSTITNSEDESDEIWNIHRSPPGLQSSVSEKLRDCSNNKSNAIKKLNQSNQMIEETLTSTSESSSDEENQSFVFGQSECKVKKSKRKKVYKYPGKLNHLILDLNIEFIASHAVKPKKIYTFSCGHDFRRDEYCSHYQNVHSDIMGSLNFMEKQCPLTQYGCSFFIRRIHPVHNGLTTKIIFNRQAFNHLIEPEICNDNNSISLIDMPIELITKILGYLDAISLNNLSLTNKLMRSLCCRQLERSGIVSLIWKKEINQTNWKIIGYQWCFSQHFSLISKWKFENDDKMLNHLTKCKHYDRIYRTEPYKLIGLCSLKR